ncbi:MULTISPECIES: recombination protein NinB [Providencia]|uniref:recombination protein NinB n=1 Tax=Providencia TaxID=586 RepID=UPI002480F3E6|nr:recombination protein NinB [Providencia rettgeri]MDU7496238.1 recombination protein NinB [Providencia rettgeri]HEM8306972.1 recombination protein NinB [Providencia rettgeri]
MSIKTYYLSSKNIRQNAIEAIQNLPIDSAKPYEVKLSEPKRTKAQNDRMWATLDDLSKQVMWQGQRYDKEDWKDLITVLNRQVNGEAQRSAVSLGSAMGLGGGIVYFGERTSKMRVKQIADVIECAHWFGSQNGVKFSDDARRELEWAQRIGDKQKLKEQQER